MIFFLCMSKKVVNKTFLHSTERKNCSSGRFFFLSPFNKEFLSRFVTSNDDFGKPRTNKICVVSLRAIVSKNMLCAISTFRCESKMQQKIESKMQQKIESKMQQKNESKMQQKIESKMQKKYMQWYNLENKL